MRPALIWLAVNGLFIAVNVIGAGVMLGLGKLMLWLHPPLGEWLPSWWIVSALALAAGLLSAKFVMDRIARRPLLPHRRA